MLKRLNKCTVGSILVVGLLSVPISAEARELGGVDLTKWCQARYPSYLGTRAVLKGNNAYSWFCEFPMFTLSRWPAIYFSVNVSGACRLQYGAGAYAKTNDSRNPYSWRCHI